FPRMDVEMIRRPRHEDIARAVVRLCGRHARVTRIETDDDVALLLVEIIPDEENRWAVGPDELDLSVHRLCNMECDLVLKSAPTLDRERWLVCSTDAQRTFVGHRGCRDGHAEYAAGDTNQGRRPKPPHERRKKRNGHDRPFSLDGHSRPRLRASDLE